MEIQEIIKKLEREGKTPGQILLIVIQDVYQSKLNQSKLNQ